MFSPLYLKQQRIPESQPIFFRRIRCRPAFRRIYNSAPPQIPPSGGAYRMQPPRFAGRHRAAEHGRRRPFGDLQHEGLRQPAVDFGPQPLAHPDVVAQPPEISPGEFRRRNDVPHHRPRHIPDRLAAEQETFEKVVLLAADQLAVHAPQRRIEPPVTGQPRTAESHIAAPGNASRRERTHPLSDWRSAFRRISTSTPDVPRGIRRRCAPRPRRPRDGFRRIRDRRAETPR